MKLMSRVRYIGAIAASITMVVIVLAIYWLASSIALPGGHILFGASIAVLTLTSLFLLLALPVDSSERKPGRAS